jgi:hypothetical protein
VLWSCALLFAHRSTALVVQGSTNNDGSVAQDASTLSDYIFGLVAGTPALQYESCSMEQEMLHPETGSTITGGIIDQVSGSTLILQAPRLVQTLKTPATLH